MFQLTELVPVFFDCRKVPHKSFCPAHVDLHDEDQSQMIRSTSSFDHVSMTTNYPSINEKHTDNEIHRICLQTPLQEKTESF